MKFNVRAEEFKAALREAFRVSEWIKIEAIAPAKVIVSSIGNDTCVGIKIEIFAPVESEGDYLINKDLQIALSSIKEDLIIADRPIKKIIGCSKDFGLFVAYSKGQLSLEIKHAGNYPQLPFEDLSEDCARLSIEDLKKIKQISRLCDPKGNKPLTHAVHIHDGVAFSTDTNILAKVHLSESARSLCCSIPLEMISLLGTLGESVQILATDALLHLQCGARKLTSRSVANQGELMAKLFENIPKGDSIDLEEWEEALSPLAPLASKIAFREGVFSCPAGEASVSSKLSVPVGFVSYRLAIAFQLLENRKSILTWTDGTKLVFSEGDRAILMQLIDPERI